MFQKPTPSRTKSRFRLLAASVAIAVAALNNSPSPAVEHWEVCRYCSQATLEDNTGAPAARRNYARDRQVDVLHFKLDVTPDFDRQTISGTATLRFAPISASLES